MPRLPIQRKRISTKQCRRDAPSCLSLSDRPPALLVPRSRSKSFLLSPRSNLLSCSSCNIMMGKRKLKCRNVSFLRNVAKSCSRRHVVESRARHDAITELRRTPNQIEGRHFTRSDCFTFSMPSTPRKTKSCVPLSCLIVKCKAKPRRQRLLLRRAICVEPRRQ